MVPSTLSSLDRVDWLPVNDCSRIVIELAGLSGASETVDITPPPHIFHGVNPALTSWSSLIPAVTAAFGPAVSVVPWATWLSALETSEQKGDFVKNPAIKLLEFYKNVDKAHLSGFELPVLETNITQTKSETLRALGPVKEDWMSQWMSQWAF
jgi:hypothetical protein